MKLKILLPFQVYLANENVVRIVAENKQGHFGLLPQRLDCVSTLVPGILTFETENEGEYFVAIDEGVLVKKGNEVFVSVRNAITGNSLEQLYEVVKKDFSMRKENEKDLRSSFQKLESHIIHQFQKIEPE